jgi:ribonuclease BN (tRNA processing enzyme)
VLTHSVAAAAEQARLAEAAKVKQLILNARPRAALGKEVETLGLIRRHYTGAVVLANDLDCVSP